MWSLSLTMPYNTTYKPGILSAVVFTASALRTHLPFVDIPGRLYRKMLQAPRTLLKKHSTLEYYFVIISCYIVYTQQLKLKMFFAEIILKFEFVYKFRYLFTTYRTLDRTLNLISFFKLKKQI